MIYEPREDSFLLAEEVKKYAKGRCLDIGTGSAIQAEAAAKKADSVLAVDIQKKVIEHCRKNVKNKKITFRQSDLFSNIKGKFDTIIFNPPYLPEDARLKDLTLDGGKKGYEVLERFINSLNNYLNEDGICLIVFSSLTNKEKVNEFLENNLFEYEQTAYQKLFFEELYAYLIKKSAILKKLNRKSIKNIKKLAKGHRGIAFSASYKGKKVVVKIKNPESEAIDKIKYESALLKELNKKGIGPKILFSDDDFILMKYVEGNLILDYFKKNNKKEIIKILKKIFEQLFVLDKMHLNKEEMHHPVKHIMINKEKVVMIDFERAKRSLDAKNVTQFCQFLILGKISEMLMQKGIKISKEQMIEAAKQYKHNPNKKSFSQILTFISSS